MFSSMAALMVMIAPPLVEPGDSSPLSEIYIVDCGDDGVVWVVVVRERT